MDIFVHGDASSVFGSGTLVVRVLLVDAAEFFNEHGVQSIKLMKVNIEGGEYDLLERLISTGEIRKVQNLQVQFHASEPGHGQRVKRIRKLLSATHELQWQYPMVWESWARKRDTAA